MAKATGTQAERSVISGLRGEVVLKQTERSRYENADADRSRPSQARPACRETKLC